MVQIFANILATTNITVKNCGFFYAPHILSQIFAPKIREEFADIFATTNITVKNCVFLIDNLPKICDGEEKDEETESLHFGICRVLFHSRILMEKSCLLATEFDPRMQPIAFIIGQ